MNDQIKKQMAEWGRRGGNKTKELHGISHFKKMSKKGVKARENKLAATNVRLWISPLD